MQWEEKKDYPAVAVAGSESVAATSIRADRPVDYPVVVDLPGRVSANASTREVSETTRNRRFSARTWNLVGAAIGALLVLATIAVFVWLFSFAISSLPSTEAHAAALSAGLSIHRGTWH